jgi:O-methyltransferase involved in polyketide biosynthesis
VETEVAGMLWVGLHVRAVDAASSRPVLGDPDAAALAEASGHDFAALRRLPAVFATAHAARTACLDDVVRAFVARNPDGVVLDLGCGLDTRVRRCAPPPGVDWFDVDLPEVVALRERLLPGTSHTVAADLTGDAGWLGAVPTDRPLLAVTDGLMALLDGPAFRSMIAAVAAHAGSGEVAFNAYTRASLRRGAAGPSVVQVSTPAAAEGVDDPREPEGWGSGLRLVEEIMVSRSPHVARYPQPWRAVAAVVARSDRMSRAGDRILHYARR